MDIEILICIHDTKNLSLYPGYKILPSTELQ